MANEFVEELKEKFDVSLVKGARAKWPAPTRKGPRAEPDHPPTIPETRSGPFEPLDGWKDDEEIGYEGER